MDLKRLTELRERIASTPTAGVFGDEALELIGRAADAERETERLRAALVWALDLLDMYDEEFAKVDGPQKVYSEIHVLGKGRARAALDPARVARCQHEWAWEGDGTWDYCTRCCSKRDRIAHAALDTALP